MNHRRKRKPTLITSFSGYFLAEVLTDVLARLPVKSLLRFRCVSKTWRELIDSPDFISMHLKFSHYNQNQNNNQDCVHILTVQNVGRKWNWKGTRFATRRSDTMRMSTPLINLSKNELLFRGSVDGLILLIPPHLVDGVLLLWNPSIRKALTVPPCPIDSLESALGFDASTNDYKVVSFEFGTYESSSREYAVYGIKDGCWRRSSRGMDMIHWERWYLSSSRLISTKGSVYWLMRGFTDDNLNRYIIVSFDFSAESLSILELPFSIPEFPGDGVKETVVSLFLLGESIAILVVSPVSMCIWVMNKDEGMEQWTRWYSGDISLDNYKLLKCHIFGTLLFLEKSSVFLMINDMKVMWYNITSHEIRQVAKSIYVAEMYIHVESLVLCRGLEGQTLTSFP